MEEHGMRFVGQDEKCERMEVLELEGEWGGEGVRGVNTGE